MTHAQALNLYPFNVVVKDMAKSRSSAHDILAALEKMGLEYIGGREIAVDLMELYKVDVSELTARA